MCRENFKGVYFGNEYLTRVNLMAAYQFRRRHSGAQRQAHRDRRRGNVAMDSASRQTHGRDFLIVYRRTERDPAGGGTHHAEEEGIEFEFLVAPVEVLGNASAGSRTDVSACSWASPTPPAALVRRGSRL